MFSEQRQAKIMQLLKEYNEVTVGSLTSILSVSEATVRRDLETLEKMNFLHRTHGGAVLISDNSPDVRAIVNQTNGISESSDNIGKTAVRLLVKDEVIAIGPGELGQAFARNIPGDFSCTVITNDALIMLGLLKRPSVKVVMVGGAMLRESDDDIFASGELAIEILDELHVDKAFLSVSGIDLEKGLTIKNYEHALIWKKLKKISNETIILAKPEAFDKKDFIKLMPVDEIKKIISSKDVSDKYKKYFFEHGIPLYTGLDL